MSGIISYGAYIPLYRLARAEIAMAWGSGAAIGEKAVANWDEDSLTMGVEAAVDCLGGIDREVVDGLYFASTTSPYLEKQAASIVAAAADLRTDIVTADFSHSLRGGASAFRAALDAVKAGSAKQVLVVAADCRLPAPKSAFESVWGDGAAALLIGGDDATVTVEESHTVSSDFLDVWRRQSESCYRTWEDRFVITYGYQEATAQVVKGLLEKANLKPSDFAKIAVYGPDARSHGALIKSLGFDAKTQVQDPLLGEVGNTGTASSMMILAAALEEAKPGDRILWVTYGDGADAYILKVEKRVEVQGERRGIKHHLASKVMMPNYEKYLDFRNLLPRDPELRPGAEGSLQIVWRERNHLTRGHGFKCRNCGRIQVPQQKFCMYCQSGEGFDDVRISDKKGTIFTFSMDERSTEPDPPNVLAAVELENDCRYFNQVTDREPAKMEVGLPVELTFRKVNEAGGFNNYCWKIRPIRQIESGHKST